MALTLQKGGNLSLTKTDPSLTKIIVGLGWDPRSTDGTEFDLDASAFLLAANGKVRGEADFIFYNQLKSQDGSIEHTGDNRTGAGDGDDEVLKVDLSRVPEAGIGADVVGRFRLREAVGRQHIEGGQALRNPAAPDVDGCSE